MPSRSQFQKCRLKFDKRDIILPTFKYLVFINISAEAETY